MEQIFWLIVFLVLLFFEIITLGLVTVWFAGGALVAFFLALFNVPWVIQLIVFLIVSFLLLFATRPFAQRYINKNTQRTNIEEVIGKIVRVSVDIDNINAVGKVTLNGEEWMARSSHEEVTIPAGTYVKILAVEGVKFIVEEVKNKTDINLENK